MRNLTEKIVGTLLPKATGKAAAAQGRCYHGCGGDGVYNPGRGRRAGEKLPCC